MQPSAPKKMNFPQAAFSWGLSWWNFLTRPQTFRRELAASTKRTFFSVFIAVLLIGFGEGVAHSLWTLPQLRTQWNHFVLDVMTAYPADREVRVSDNKLTLTGEVPWRIEWPRTLESSEQLPQYFLLIDPTLQGEPQHWPESTHTAMFVAAETMLASRQEDQWQTMTWSEALEGNEPLVVTKKTVGEVLDVVTLWIERQWMSLRLLFPWMFMVMRTAQVSLGVGLYIVMALLLARVTGSRLKASVIARICLRVGGIAMLAESLGKWLAPDVPYFLIAFWLYYTVATVAVRTERFLVLDDS